MRNLLFKISFEGSSFHGWQQQDNAVTVQGELKAAFQRLTGETPNIIGCSRTDAGVHANEYFFNVRTESTIPVESFPVALMSAKLPGEIAVHSCKEVDYDFHARYDAKSREYCYFVHFVKDPFSEKFSYRMRYPLDIEAMNKACEHLLGEHDFSCFEKVGGNNTTSICSITEASWSTYRPNHVELMGSPYTEGDYIVFRISANRFLRNMVRAIVGSLIEVGRGKKDPAWITELIASKSRSAAGQSVPGNALFFCGAEY